MGWKFPFEQAEQHVFEELAIVGAAGFDPTLEVFRHFGRDFDELDGGLLDRRCAVLHPGIINDGRLGRTFEREGFVVGHAAVLCLRLIGRHLARFSMSRRAS